MWCCHWKKSRERHIRQTTAALRDVIVGTSIKIAAAKWKVPQSSLQYLLKTGNDPECRPGQATILTKIEEELLADWLIEMSRRGIPINKQNLLDRWPTQPVHKRQTGQGLVSCVSAVQLTSR